MDDDIVFSDHSVLRISERTSLSPGDIHTRLTKQIAVLVNDAVVEPQFKYLVLWDSPKNKPLLVILRKLKEAQWEVVTLYETMTYHKRGDRVMVLPRHIVKARKREVRYVNEGHPEGADGSKDRVRLHVIVRFYEYGQPKSRRHKIGSVTIHEFLSTHEGKAECLLSHFVQIGKMDHVPVPDDSAIEAEVLQTENNTLRVLSSWS
jgi:hypothetical protein